MIIRMMRFLMLLSLFVFLVLLKMKFKSGLQVSFLSIFILCYMLFLKPVFVTFLVSFVKAYIVHELVGGNGSDRGTKCGMVFLLHK